jgi:hypothetical protein
MEKPGFVYTQRDPSILVEPDMSEPAFTEMMVDPDAAYVESLSESVQQQVVLVESRSTR